MTSANKDILSCLSDDSVDAGLLANLILKQKDLSVYMLQIDAEITSLNEKIHSHIISKHDDLMSHAVGIEKLEGVLEMMNSRTSNLRNHTEKIRSKLAEPYNSLSMRVRQLNNMQLACDTLRKINRINSLVVKLKNQNRDPTKASATVNELRYVFRTTNYHGIKILSQHYDFMLLTTNSLVDEAWAMVKLVKETNNQAMLGVALQIFSNLEILHYSVNKIVVDSQNEISNNIKQILDVKLLHMTAQRSSPSPGGVKGPGKAAIPTAGQGASFRATFWTVIDKLVNHIEINMALILLLAKVLHKKRDMNSQHLLVENLRGSYSSERNDDDDVGDRMDDFCVQLFSDSVAYTGYFYQNWMSDILRETFKSSMLSDQTGFFRQTLDNEYPKLLKLFLDLGGKLSSFIDVSSLDVNKQQSSNDYENLSIQKYFRTFLLEYEQIFLSKSLSRLFEMVDVAFDKDERYLPTDEEIVNFVRNISSEVTQCSLDSNLLLQACRNVGKTIDLVCTKFEGRINADGEASQILTSMTNSQKYNFKIVNLLSKFKNNIGQCIIRQLRLNETNESIIQEKLDHCLKVQTTAIQPLLDNMKKSIEEIISSVHLENFYNCDKADDTSFMMKELKTFIAKIRSQYLDEIADEELLENFMKCLANYTAEVFLIHICLIRPISDFGKNKIALDIEQFEFAIRQFCVKNHQINTLLEHNIYRNIRAIRSLIFQSINTIVENYQSTEKKAAMVLPASYALHHLFSRAPVEVKSPFQSVSWSIPRYVTWVLTHPSESERLVFIKGSLDAYANAVRLQEKKQYADIYVQMMTVIDCLTMKR